MNTKKAGSIKILVIYLLIALVGAGVFIFAFRHHFFPQPVGKIALIIDDWGYNQLYFDVVKELDIPINCAVLPGLNYTRIAAERLKKNGAEIILHLPMEPKLAEYKYMSIEVDTIMTTFREEKILQILRKDLKELEPLVRGVSNHMGSQATTDVDLMTIIFRELKRRNLYFVDSYVVAGSVCQALADKIGVKFAMRSIFLDNERNTKYIRGQIEEMAQIAAERGLVVAIGHNNDVTLNVLREEVPKLKKRGFKFVYVSQIATYKRFLPPPSEF
jgi:polysaccharide deacetylase 2 family uncharacterized protein YibQ